MCDHKRQDKQQDNNVEMPGQASPSVEWWVSLQVPAWWQFLSQGWRASATVQPACSPRQPENTSSQQDSSSGQQPSSEEQPAVQLPVRQVEAQGAGEAPQLVRGGEEVQLLPARLTYVQPRPSQLPLVP